MQIGELATATGLSRDSLRFYEKRGLLRARRDANGYRNYPPEASGPLLRAALQRKLADIDERIKGLTDLRRELARRLEEPMADCPLRPV